MTRFALPALLAALAAVPAPHAQSFAGLGDLPGGTTQSVANAVSGDGTVVVGHSESAVGRTPFRWTAATGIEALAGVPAGPFSSAYDASGDGRVIIGQAGEIAVTDAYRWTEAGGMQAIAGTISGRGTSADGAVVVGQVETSTKAYRWSEDDGLVVLGSVPPWLSSIARAVSADGTVVVGDHLNAHGSPGFRWTAADGLQQLPDLDGSRGAEVRGTSADGSVIVGHSSMIATGSFLATRWVDGVPSALPGIPGESGSSYAEAVSADGSVIVGHQGDEAFIWTPEDGTRRLRDVLVNDFGLDLTGWTLTRAYDVSDDGTVIVGLGTNPAGQLEGWRAALGDTFAVTAPAEDEIVPPGEPYEVRFLAPHDAEAVDLYLVERALHPGGREPVLVAEGVPAAGTYTWDVPEDLLSPSTYLIAVDADDPSREAVSARFRVREPWRLHRVVGPLQRPEYEKIERARHAWSFDQRPENMWPETYWNHRYHYYGNTEVGYDRFVEPVPDVRYDPEFFAGHTASENPTWPSFVRAFGMAGTYASAEPWGLPGFLLHQPNREAADFWDTKTHQFDGYEGACYGLSMAMMAAFQDPERFDAKWLPTSGGSETLASVPLTDEVRDAAHALLAYQWGRLQRNQNELNVGVTPRETLERLRLMFERDDRTRDRFITLRSYYHDGDGSRRYGGHAVVPLGMQRTGEGLYAIGVFDPNTGGVAPEYVFVDSTANAWTYSDSFWEGAEGKGLYLSIEAIYAFDPASTSWPHVFEENAAGPPLAARGGGSEHRSVGIVGRGGAVTSAAGALRYEGGVLTETLPGGFVSFPYTGGPSDPDAYVVPADGGPYRAEAVPRDDGIARVRVEGGPVTATFAQAEAAAATRAVVDLLDDGLAVVSGGGGVFTLGATAAAGGAPELRSVRVRDLASADPAGLALTAAPDAATFRLVGADEPTTYDLTVGRAAPGEHRTFHHAAVPLAAGAVHTVRPDWGHLAGGTVTVEVDLDGDGEPDEVLVLEDEGYPVGAEPSRPEGLPSSYALHAAAPNPFAGRTTLRYDLPEAAPVRLVVYDLLGREVAVLVDGEREAGTHAAVLDGRGFAAGVYVVRMTAGGRDFTQRLTLVR